MRCEISSIQPLAGHQIEHGLEVTLFRPAYKKPEGIVLPTLFVSPGS